MNFNLQWDVFLAVLSIPVIFVVAYAVVPPVICYASEALMGAEWTANNTREGVCIPGPEAKP